MATLHLLHTSSLSAKDLVGTNFEIMTCLISFIFDWSSRAAVVLVIVVTPKKLNCARCTATLPASFSLWYRPKISPIGLRGEAVGGSIRFVARGGVTGIVWVENGGRYVDVEGKVWVWTGVGIQMLQEQA